MTGCPSHFSWNIFAKNRIASWGVCVCVSLLAVNQVADFSFNPLSLSRPLLCCSFFDCRMRVGSSSHIWKGWRTEDHSFSEYPKTASVTSGSYSSFYRDDGSTRAGTDVVPLPRRGSPEFRCLRLSRQKSQNEFSIISFFAHILYSLLHDDDNEDRTNINTIIQYFEECS